jgi:hypothetical protein
MARLFGNPTQAYRVLNAEHWVRRQHHGASDLPHTRFMRPLCLAIYDAPAGELAQPRTANVVLFVRLPTAKYLPRNSHTVLDALPSLGHKGPA